MFSDDETARLLQWDKDHVWHPFTPMRDWCAPDHEPLMLLGGGGEWLIDQRGKRYLDGNSSIWTNIHGHRHPKLDAAVRAQLDEVAHVSALGFANAPAARLAKALTELWPPQTLTKVFFSDNGSTAIECALKMAIQYRQNTGTPERNEFAAFDLAYHGDTMGAASLGGISAFHERFRGFGLTARHFTAMDELHALPRGESDRLTAVVIEPLMQGAAGMRAWPRGMLADLRAWCDERGVLLICDEVMTGFGRTGRMFACEHENVIPDFVAVAKGLTGGYMPLAATLTSERVFNAFLGAPEEGKTFYYGHSYCAHPLGCAAALANLEIFREEQTLERLQPKIAALSELLAELQANHPRHIGAVRQCGFMAGIDLLADAPAGVPFPAAALTGARVCRAARARGLLTRPVRDTLVLMPPLVTSDENLRLMVNALDAAVLDTLGSA